MQLLRPGEGFSSLWRNDVLTNVVIMFLGLSTRLVRKAIKPALACWFAVLVLFAAVLSSAPVLHEQFHRNCSSPSSGCVICQFAHGQVGMADVTVCAVVYASALCFFPAPLSRTVFSSFDYRLSPSRAPPRG